MSPQISKIHLDITGILLMQYVSSIVEVFISRKKNSKYANLCEKSCLEVHELQNEPYVWDNLKYSYKINGICV